MKIPNVASVLLVFYSYRQFINILYNIRYNCYISAIPEINTDPMIFLFSWYFVPANIYTPQNHEQFEFLTNQLVPVLKTAIKYFSVRDIILLVLFRLSKFSNKNFNFANDALM